MYKPIYLLFAPVFLCLAVQAQTLRIFLPFHAGKQALIIATHGTMKDTVGTIALDKNGLGTFSYENKVWHTGLAALAITGKPNVDYGFVLATNENASIQCIAENPTPQNTEVSGSPENTSLNRWFDNMARYGQKESLTAGLLNLYPKSNLFYKQAQQEEQLAQRQKNTLLDTIKKSPLFAARYIQFRLAQAGILAKVYAGNEERKQAKNYFAAAIDFDALYGSGLWFPIINGCTAAYTKEGPYFGQFGGDVVGNLKKTSDQAVVVALADAAISVCERFSWQADQDAIVDYLIASNRITSPQGKLRKLFQMAAAREGKKAPDIMVEEHAGSVGGHNNSTITIKPETLSPRYSLLLFHETGCGNCENAVKQLEDNYGDLVKNGFRVLSFASDVDEAGYMKSSEKFPWKDRYCDLKGFNGGVFRSYGIIGTPTMFILDKNGTIRAKLATVEELLKWIRDNNGATT